MCFSFSAHFCLVCLMTSLVVLEPHSTLKLYPFINGTERGKGGRKTGGERETERENRQKSFTITALQHYSSNTLTCWVRSSSLSYSCLARSSSFSKTSKSIYAFHNSYKHARITPRLQTILIVANPTSGISNTGWLTASSRMDLALSSSPRRFSNSEYYNKYEHDFRNGKRINRTSKVPWSTLCSWKVGTEEISHTTFDIDQTHAATQ